MRRWRFLTLALAVLLAAGLGVSAAHVQAEGRNVVYDETILQGEAGDFSDVTLHLKNRMGNELYWLTDYHPGTSGAAETHTRYGKSDWTPGEGKPPVQAVCHLLNAPEGRNDAEADAMVENVAARTPEHETREEVLRAADWYAYFPLEAELYGEPLADTLQIPVPEDLMVRVTVSRTDDQHYSFTIREASGAGPTLDAVSAGYRDGEITRCWFALDTGELDTALLPGSGILKTDSAARKADLAYPLPAGTKVHDLWLSPDGETLYALYTLDGAHTLTALRTEDMTVRQTIPLPIEAEALSPIWRDERLKLVPLWRSDSLLLVAADETLTALSTGSDGLYTVQAQVNIAGDAVFAPPLPLQFRDLLTACAQDGRLVLARQQYVEEDPAQDMDLILSVYGADGQRSTMECRCSLGRETLPVRYFNGRNNQLQPGWTQPVEVTIEP